MVEKEHIVEAFKQVIDPELNIDVWTLGLIYDVDIENGNAKVKMTYTSPACPYGPQLVADVKKKLTAVNGISRVDVEVVFNPPWQPSQELRDMIGM